MYKLFYYVKEFLSLQKEKEVDKDALHNSRLHSITLSIRKVCEEEFGVTYPLSWDLLPPASHESVLNLILEIKLRIVELDMGRIFQSTGKILENLFTPFRSIYPDLDPKVYRALMGMCYPAGMCLNNILRKQVDYINRLSANDETLNVFELGISKYFLAENVLTMRAAHSISLAESQMTK